MMTSLLIIGIKIMYNKFTNTELIETLKGRDDLTCLEKELLTRLEQLIADDDEFINNWVNNENYYRR